VILLVSLAVALGASLLWAGVAALTTPQVGPGAFYKVVPWLWMFLPATLLTIVGAVAVGIGVARYWLDIGSVQRRDGLTGSVIGALSNAITLRYLDGGGPGCDYPDEVPASGRKWFHHLVFWGFVAAFISTCLAFVYQDILGVLPPYPFLSPPVLSGTGGGIAMIIGGFGLIALKRRSDREPADAVMLVRDYSFLASLLIISVTGLVLLAFRESAVIGLLLDIHLACVLAFFLTAPYSKFVHAAYRGAALLHDRIERRAESTSSTS
jgi:citrate/tricarballylate utilization protein